MVLVVDDDPMSRELLGVLLEGEGYRAATAESGEAALAWLAQGRPAPDVVLVDIQMPGIAGAQLARRLRRACGEAAVLLAMSGSQPPEKAVAAFDGFLLKPFQMAQVTAAVEGRARPAAPRKPRRPPAKGKSQKESWTVVSGPGRTLLPDSSLVSISAAPEEASKSSMNLEAPQSSPSIPLQQDGAPVLNEAIFQRLTHTMPAEQLLEMYSMCLKDARRRIASMRALAAEHDSAQFVREAHAIKGGCGMLGATELHRMAAELEGHGLEAGPDGPQKDVNSLDELSAACDRLERMLGSRV